MLKTEPLFVVDGVPVFADHADEHVFWYLPTQVSLAQRNGQPVLSFIKYRDPEGRGGGLLSFQVDLGLSPHALARIEGRLSELDSRPRLVPVPFTEGSVQCVTLDAGSGRESSGDMPRLVNQVLGTAHPSLQGMNSAIFTLSLGSDGAQVVEAALKGGQSLLGVVYQLDYTAMQPPLQVKLTARMEQIYRFLGASVGAQYKFVRADLSAAIERMKAQKKLVIERIDTVGTPASAQELEEVTRLFTDQLLKDWFTPLLVPGSPRTPTTADTRGGPAPSPGPAPGPGDDDGRNPFQAGASRSTPKTAAPEPADNPFADPQPATDPGGGSGNPFDDPPQDKPEDKPKDKPEERPSDNPFDAPETPPKPDGSGQAPATPPSPQSIAWQQAVDGAAQGVAVLSDSVGKAAAQALPLPQVTLQLKALDQKELRDFHAEYNSRQAVRRTYRPQGFFGLSPAVLEKLPGAFLEVDTHSEFWKKFVVAIHGPDPGDFDRLGLNSAVSRIEYGQDAHGRSAIDQSFRFSRQQTQDIQTFATPMLRGERRYRQRLTYAFDHRWTGDPAPRTLELASSDLRDVYLAPQRDFRFVTVNASFTESPDWQQLSQIHLSIGCATTAEVDAERFEKNVVIHPGWTPSLAPASEADSELPWRIRFKAAGPEPLRIEYSLVYHFKNGTSHASGPFQTSNVHLVLRPAP